MRMSDPILHPFSRAVVRCALVSMQAVKLLQDVRRAGGIGYDGRLSNNRL
jgi:hypothetical protein